MYAYVSTLPVRVRTFLYNTWLAGVGLNLVRVGQIPHPDLEVDGYRVLHPVLVRVAGVQSQFLQTTY